MDKHIRQFINSGILEQYLLGLTDRDEEDSVLKMVSDHPEVLKELRRLLGTIESHGRIHALKPPDVVRAFILASTDYLERLNNGEKPAATPDLSEDSAVQDFVQWLDRKDMICPTYGANVVVKTLSHTSRKTTCLVWIKDNLEPEIHRHERESFLIVEGSCELYVGEETHELKAGDFMRIPLGVTHSAKVTSQGPCKFILEHLAV